MNSSCPGLLDTYMMENSILEDLPPLGRLTMPRKALSLTQPDVLLQELDHSELNQTGF